MRKSIVTLGMLAAVFALSLTSCKDTEANLKQTQENVLDAKVDLMESKNEAAEAMEKFKLDVYEKISDNNKKIRDLRVKEIKGSPKDRQNYIVRIDDLNTKNEVLKNKLDAYTTYDASSYENFKNDLQKTTDDLEREFRELESRN